MNALCQEQSIVSGAIIFFSSGDLLSNTSPVGLGLRQATEKSLPLASAMPRVKARAFLRLHVETMYCHTQRIHLKWEKKVIYPLVRGAEACKKDTSSGYQCRDSMHVDGARRNAMQNCSDKLTSDLIFELKLAPKLLQNRAPSGANDFQNPFWRTPGGPS